MRHFPNLFSSGFRYKRRLLVCAGLTGFALIVAVVDHPWLFVLRAKAASFVADDPDVALDFKRDPADRPVLSSGTAETPMIAMDPCVISDAEGWHMFFSSFFCDTPQGPSAFWKPEFGEQFDTMKLPTGIAYAFSADRGQNWTVRPTPLLLPVAVGWDDFRVETANALVKDGVLHLFYCADSKRKLTRYQIGEVSLALAGKTLREALLEQGRSPSRSREIPLLAGITDRSSFRNNVQEPSVLYADGRFELYFVGLEWSLPAEAVRAPGQALRRAGLGRAVLDDSLNVLEISDEPLLELDLVNIIEVKRTDAGLVLFMTLKGQGKAHRGEKIGYRTSRDGRSWSPSKVLITPSVAGYDSWGCMSPTVVQEADRWVLFYTALENAQERPDGRWGMSLGRDGWLFGTLGRAESVAP
ncbi:MAG: hypothetical protein ACT4QC_18340 [Planctomycetaceae bacterium]